MKHQLAKLFFYLATIILFANEVHLVYIIGSGGSHVQLQSCGDPGGKNIAGVENDIDLTLSQFVNKSSIYLTNDTALNQIFSPGNYSLESELIIENVQLFSMYGWSISLSKAVITCGDNARFEFRNVGIVTVSGLEFVGCFENYVLSVGQFQLENSAFCGNGQAIVNSTEYRGECGKPR